MPVRVADIPNLQPTSINAPRVDGRAAAAPAQAMGAIAQGIADVGSAFAGIAQQVNEAENVRQLSTTRTALDEARSQLFIDLQREPDPEAHIRRTDEFLQQQRQLVEDPELSRAVRQRLATYFDEWASDTRLNVAADAAKLTARRANLALENEALAAYESNNASRFTTAWDDAVNSGLRLPEERDAAMREFQTKQQRDAEIRTIHADPGLWLDENPEPPAGADPVAFQNNRRMARQLLHQETAETVEQVQDMMASGKITTPEQLDQLAGNLRPAALERLKADLANRGNAEFDALRRTPEYQEQIVGEVSAMLADYSLDAEGFDTDFVAMDSMVRTLPPGAVKTELGRRLNEVRQQQFQEIDDSASYARQQLTDAYKNGFFGNVTASQSTTSATDAGLLEDAVKLRAAGFSPDQVKEITDADLSATERRRVFRRLWSARPDTDEFLAPYTRTAFEALARGDSQVSHTDPEKDRQAQRAFGKAKIQLESWLKAHPKATEEQIQSKLFEIVGSGKTEAFLDSIFTGLLPPLNGTPGPAVEIGIDPPPSR